MGKDIEMVDRALKAEEKVKFLESGLTEAREILEEVCCQFAPWRNGGLSHGCHSALERAFKLLGWEDPHPCPEQCCDEPGCREQATGGTPTPTGYRRTCREHAPPPWGTGDKP